MSKKGKTHRVGSFAEFDKKLDSGKWNQQQYDDFFSNARLHGLAGNIFPFAVGGSDTGAIMGVSKWATKRVLQLKKLGKYQEIINEKKQYALDYGHIFEDAVGKMCTQNLAEELNAPLKYVPCQDEYVNEAWPHFLAHPDGFITNNGKPFALAEVKTTYRWSDAWKDEFSNGTIPEEYYTQVQSYMYILGFKICYILVSNKDGNYKENFKAIRIDLDENYAETILDECEKFVEDTMNGITFTGKDAPSIKVLKEENDTLYGMPDPSAPDSVKLDKGSIAKFKRLDEITEEVKALKEFKKEDEKKLKEKYKNEDQMIKNLEDEQDRILNEFVDDIQNSSYGILEDGDTVYTVNLKRNFSFNQSVKNYFQKNYPDVWDDITSQKPTISPSYSKVSAAKE